MNNKDIIFLFELFFISLYEWSYKNIDKINPNHFQIINKDIAIFLIYKKYIRLFWNK